MVVMCHVPVEKILLFAMRTCSTRFRYKLL